MASTRQEMIAMAIATSIGPAVAEVAACLSQDARVRKILLFGSRAAGTDRPDSDIDVLVVCEGSPGKFETIADLRERLPWPREYSVDILVMGERQFEVTKSVIGGIAYPAHKHGKVLYERPAA